MTTKFAHIKLGRAFRPHVLSELKSLSTWAGYLNLRGWNKRSSAITGDDIRQACEDLGFDLNAAFVDFFRAPTIAAGVNATGATVMAQVNAIEANEYEEREMDSEPAAPPVIETNANNESESESEGFEGRDADTLIAEALAPASAHMTPHLAQMMPGLLRPFVEAATKGPRVVTKTVVKTVVSGDGSESASVAPIVNVLRKERALRGVWHEPKRRAERLSLCLRKRIRERLRLCRSARCGPCVCVERRSAGATRRSGRHRNERVDIRSCWHGQDGRRSPVRGASGSTVCAHSNRPHD